MTLALDITYLVAVCTAAGLITIGLRWFLRHGVSMALNFRTTREPKPREKRKAISLDELCEQYTIEREEERVAYATNDRLTINRIDDRTNRRLNGKLTERGTYKRE